jgi:hypothetical protein
MIEQARANLGAVADETAADGSYGSQQQVGEAARRGWPVTVPVAKRGELDKPFHSHRFVYDPDRDVMICPRTGQALTYSTTKKERPGHLACRVYRCPVHRTCPFARDCTKSMRSARLVEKTVHRDAVLAQVYKRDAGYLAVLMRRRLGTVEPVFGWMKEHFGLRRFWVCGLTGVRAQWALACTVLNLRRIIAAWRRKVAGSQGPPCRRGRFGHAPGCLTVCNCAT